MSGPEDFSGDEAAVSYGESRPVSFDGAGLDCPAASEPAGAGPALAGYGPASAPGGFGSPLVDADPGDGPDGGPLRDGAGGGGAEILPLPRRRAGGRALPAEVPMRRVLEAVLFATDRPVTPAQLAVVLPSCTTEEIELELEHMAHSYAEAGCGFRLLQSGRGFEIRTDPEMHEFVTRFLVGKRRARLTRASMETLAMIAYRQPITRGECEDIRGVDCGQVIHTLLERDLITVRGRSQALGRPLLYGTTEEFLRYFGITSLADLPSPEEIGALIGHDPLDDPEILAALEARGLGAPGGNGDGMGDGDGVIGDESGVIGDADCGNGGNGDGNRGNDCGNGGNGGGNRDGDAAGMGGGNGGLAEGDAPSSDAPEAGGLGPRDPITEAVRETAGDGAALLG